MTNISKANSTKANDPVFLSMRQTYIKKRNYLKKTIEK